MNSRKTSVAPYISFQPLITPMPPMLMCRAALWVTPVLWASITAYPLQQSHPLHLCSRQCSTPAIMCIQDQPRTWLPCNRNHSWKLHSSYLTKSVPKYLPAMRSRIWCSIQSMHRSRPYPWMWTTIILYIHWKPYSRCIRKWQCPHQRTRPYTSALVSNTACEDCMVCGGLAFNWHVSNSYFQNWLFKMLVFKIMVRKFHSFHNSWYQIFETLIFENRHNDTPPFTNS